MSKILLTHTVHLYSLRVSQTSVLHLAHHNPLSLFIQVLIEALLCTLLYSLHDNPVLPNTVFMIQCLVYNCTYCVSGNLCSICIKFVYIRTFFKLLVKYTGRTVVSLRLGGISYKVLGPRLSDYLNTLSSIVLDCSGSFLSPSNIYD